jgi:hypothetical protein
MAEPEPTKEELLQRIAALERQVRDRKPAALEFRVSDKGAVSVYGLGRFPVCDTVLRAVGAASGPR